MSSPFETYVDKIIQEIDGKKEDNADLKEELLTHLTQAKEDFIKEGHNDKQATHLALQHFGDATSIGENMQQALFPHRRLSLMILAFLSLFSIFSTYITALVVNKDAFIIWLCIAVTTSIILLIFMSHLFPKLERNSLLISLLIVHALLMVYGYVISSGIDHTLSIFLNCCLLATIVFTIFLLYRVVLYDYSFPFPALKLIHVINMTFGIIYISSCLFYLWVLLAFFEQLEMAQFIPLFFIMMWIISYVIQIQWMKHNNKKASYIVLGCTHLILLGLLFSVLL